MGAIFIRSWGLFLSVHGELFLAVHGELFLAVHGELVFSRSW
ncbi:MAG: hypothetical protein ACKE9I_03560 [Methylophagaceae bacterium]